jgi:Cu/Ag efflux pump CusA
VTQIVEGSRRFNLVLRLPETSRSASKAWAISC